VPDLYDLIDDSLEILAREVPALYARLRAAMGGRAVTLEVDGALARLAAEGPALRLTRGARGGAVHLSTTTAAARDLAEGRCTLLEAVLGERVAARGDLEDLGALHEALRIYLGAAVRCPSAAALLETLRGMGR